MRKSVISIWALSLGPKTRELSFGYWGGWFLDFAGNLTELGADKIPMPESEPNESNGSRLVPPVAEEMLPSSQLWAMYVHSH